MLRNYVAFTRKRYREICYVLRSTKKYVANATYFSDDFGSFSPKFLYVCKKNGVPAPGRFQGFSISPKSPEFCVLKLISYLEISRHPKKVESKDFRSQYHPMQINAASPLNAGSLTFGPSLIVLQLESHSFPVLTSALCCLIVMNM